MILWASKRHVFALWLGYKKTNNCKRFKHFCIHSVVLICSQTVVPWCTLSGQLNVLHTRPSCPVTQNTASCWIIEVRGSLQKGWQWRWWDPEDCVWRWSHVWALHAWRVKVHQKVHSTCHVDYLQVTTKLSYTMATIHTLDLLVVSFVLFQGNFSE
jgi:hypothetical protein